MVAPRLFALLALAIGLTVTVPAIAETRFTTLRIPDPQGGDIEIGVWSPDAPTAGPAPLVVMSHGNGGWYRGAEDTARALADAGFVAAALTHTGDNFRDQSRALDMANRPRQLRVLTDYMLSDWKGPVVIDADRVGAFGFSSGGFTVLADVGAVPDAKAIAQHCRQGAAYFDCRLIANHRANPTTWTGWRRDPRIKAVVSAAPALGFAFTTASLATIRIPVQLWRAEQDEVLPSPLYVEPVRDRLPTPPEYHLVPNAGHFDFLPPCNAAVQASSPEICVSQPGFDRAGFHVQFNREVVRFFRGAL
jgi:predicted dienelactone hydrolase